MDLVGTLQVLVRVVETGSFSAVARERDLTQAAVARQIAQLEEHFGVRLFHRTTRKLSLTDDGQMLLGLTRPVLRFLVQRLPTLLAGHPGLKVELVISDRFGDMIQDRLDLALRVGEITDSSLIKRRSWTGERIAVVAPSYIERHGAPTVPADLEHHTCILHNVGSDSDVWTFVTPEGPKQVRVNGGFLANDFRAVRQAAEIGYGIALLPLLEVFDDLQSGQLFSLLNGFPAPGFPVSLVYPSRRHLAPRTRVVMEFVLAQMQEVRSSLEARTRHAAPASAVAND